MRIGRASAADPFRTRLTTVVVAPRMRPATRPATRAADDHVFDASAFHDHGHPEALPGASREIVGPVGWSCRNGSMVGGGGLEPPTSSV